MAKTNKLYCDGGKTKWCVVFEGGETWFSGHLHETAINDDTESAAILNACRHAEEHSGNWVVITDSQAVIDKVRGNCANATKNPNIAGIRNILKRAKESPLPVSIELKWMKRLSTPEMRRADEGCRE